PKEKPIRSSLIELSLMRARLFYREPAAMFWTFGFPMLLSVALGIAFRNQTPQPVRVAIEVGPAAAHLETLLASHSEIYAREMSAEAAHQALRTGNVAVVVIAEQDAKYTYRFDASRPDSRLARVIVDDAIEQGEGRIDHVSKHDELVTEPGSRYIDFLIPGLVGIGLMSSGLWGVGYALTEMRTKKLLKRLAATPMKKGEFLFSFLLIRALFVLVEVPPLLLFARLVFGVEVHGSYALLGFVTILGGLTFAGLGLLIGSRTASSEVVQGLINFVSLPMYMCSGVFFSADRFPEWAQPVVRILPLTALNDALRRVMTDGANTAGIARELAIVTAWGVVSFGVALRLFRWR
ncbi:MAG: ABC transporter permease, partial [Polyangiaceae bacterium]